MSWIGIWYETIRRFGSSAANSASAVLNRAGRLPATVAYEIQVSEGRDLAVGDGSLDAVAVHVGEPRLRVTVAGGVEDDVAPTRSHADGRLRLAELLLRAPALVRFDGTQVRHGRRELAQRRVVRVVVLRRQVRLHRIVGEVDVIVGRDETFVRRRSGHVVSDLTGRWT